MTYREVADTLSHDKSNEAYESLSDAIEMLNRLRFQLQFLETRIRDFDSQDRKSSFRFIGRGRCDHAKNLMSRKGDQDVSRMRFSQRNASLFIHVRCDDHSCRRIQTASERLIRVRHFLVVLLE